MIRFDDLRAVVRPYAAGKIGLPAMLQQLWPLLRQGDHESGELVRSIEDVVALHASKCIDETAFRQRLVAIAFAPGAVAHATISDVHSLSNGTDAPGRVMSMADSTRTLSETGQLFPA